MSVVGVGVDAIEIARLRAALQRTPSLLGRLYTEGEQVTCASRSGELNVAGLAARFCAKEAVAKAFGTGVRGFAFRDIEVGNDDLGKPVVVLHGPAAIVARRLGIAAVHLSLSTTREVAIAQAVAESPQRRLGA